MNVILLKDVDKVGLRGDVVSVARGYARNYLFPRSLAEEATNARVAELRKREGQRAQHEAKTADQAQSIAETLNKTVLTFEMKAGPTGSLFGSVTPTDIADEIWRTRKIRVDRRKIDVDNLKRIGRYEVPIDLFDGVRVEVKTLVVPEGGELPSDEELEAMAAVEAAEQAAAAPVAAPEVEYEDMPEPAERTQSPAEAAESADGPAPEAEAEPDWRADADEALKQQ
jgi:large subunit ribosomal protein L9